MLHENLFSTRITTPNLDIAFLNLLPGCVYWKDINSRYQGCNLRHLQRCGLSNSNLIIGKTDRELPLLSQHVDKLEANERTVLEKRKHLCFMEESNDYLGIPELYYACKAPLYNASGEIVGIIGMSLLMEKVNVTKFRKLTTREIQCLYYLAHGRSAREIGAFLGISPRTVEDHIAVMKRKYGVKKKSELVDLYYAGTHLQLDDINGG